MSSLSRISSTRRRSRRAPPPASSHGLGREFVQGLERGFAVIRAFSTARAGLTIAQTAQLTGLTRAVVRRHLLTLRELGYVVQHGSTFVLTPRILDLGFTYLSTIDVANVAEPFLERMVEALHESCSVSVLEGHDVIYVARVPAKRIMSVNLVVGSRLPAHATSMGKVLLAYLPQEALETYLATAPLQRLTPRTISDERTLRQTLAVVRDRGWAVSDGELEDGVRTAAAPLVDHTGQVTAAINITGHASRISMRQLRLTYLPVLLDAAREISHALGGREPAALRPGVHAAGAVRSRLGAARAVRTVPLVPSNR